MGKRSNILLSISILVSNRIDTIKKCMESLKPLLLAVPSELIVVDTVGEEQSDGSLAIAKEYATKVVHFDWCRDFAAARNAGLSQAQGEWFMFLDDDEWFDDISEIIEFFKSGEYKQYNSATYQIRDHLDRYGAYSIGTLFRMVKIEPDTRFVEPIHEYLTPFCRPCKELKAFIHHYGYAYDTEEEKKAHYERNLSLLEPLFEKDPWNLHVRMQLIQEYGGLDEYKEKAKLLCEETQDIDPKQYKSNEFQWIMVSYVRLANNQKEYEEVISRGAQFRERFPIGALADLAVCTMEVNAHFQLKEYEKGVAVFLHAMERRTYLLQHPEVRREMRILDLENFLEDNMYVELLKYGIRCYYSLGNFEEAARLNKERFAVLERPVLTVSVLVSNRKETIRKCMESIRPLLDTVPSELIVVDTVGEADSDGSLAVAKEYTNHIVPFAWTDDFAAARNAGLKRAKGEWFLYLDDDEWFENIEELTHFFLSGEYFEYNSATYVVRNYKDSKGSNYQDAVACRMIHRAKKSEFVGCVNETFNNTYSPHKAFSAYVHHYGFVYATPEAKQAKMQYTMRLLQKDLELYPKNLKNRLQLAIVYSVRDPKAAIALCEETLTVCRENQESESYRRIEGLLEGLYTKYPQWKRDKEIVLSISMLVSNRIDTVKKSLEALRPLLEAIPSELIIVDTVGEENSDGSLAIAKEYATELVHFDWCNDFSAARNAGLSKAHGEWFLYQDDDEYFDDVTEIIEFFKSGEYKNYNCATYRTRDYTNKDGSYTMGVANRMVKLCKETRFVEPVHEYLTPMTLPCKALSAFTHHYGYVFESPEKHKAHSERNLSLLRPVFEKNRKDIRLLAQMVQECMFLEELEPEAVALCEEALELEKSYYKYPNFQWILTAYLKLAVRKSDWQQALERIERIRSKFPLTEFGSLAVCIMELKVRAQLGMHEEAEGLLQRVKEAREFLLCKEEERVLQESFDISIFLEPSILADGMAQGIISLHKLGKVKEAENWEKERRKLLDTPVLTVSLLVSNNIKTIEKCMKSLQPLLAAVPSELIVVDTVGEEHSDGSLAVAKQYATRVVHFDWCNDFAAARNAGLALAQGEWFMFLDDDEWFENTKELEDFFRSGEYLLYASGTYQIRNYTKKDGSAYSMATLGRMTKRGKNTKFVGAIHETFSEFYLPCKEFSAFVHHYGYAFENEQEKQAHVKRNFTLLQRELEKNPKHLRYRTQMAMELASFDNRGAMEFCKETFRLCEEQKAEPGFQWQLSLVFRLHEALGTMPEAAEQEYLQLKKQFGFNETAENGICFQMTRICILKDEPERGIAYAKRYFETYAYLQQNPQVKQKQMTADFARYQTTEAYLELLHFGAYCAYRGKAYETAWEWYAAMPWETPGYTNQEGFGFVLQMYRENPKKELLEAIVERIMKNPREMNKEEVRNRLSQALSFLGKEGGTVTTGVDWIQSNIKLTIGILVSNNISTVCQCMESLQPILESVSSELIVVDTVGEENSDGSLAVAKEYATKLIHFDWCDDFAAARNVCIDHAEGEWFLYVDDDEWFGDVSEVIAFFNSGECDSYGHAAYYLNNYAAGGGISRTLLGRFVRRTPETRFKGRVHEQLLPVYSPCKQLSIDAYHKGYCYATEEEKKQHQQRNMVLLRQELEEKGYDPHLCSQMVQELLHVEGTWDEGYRFAMDCLPVLVEEQGAIKDSGTQWILFATVRYFGMTDDYTGQLKQTTYIRENYALSETAELAISAVTARSAWLIDCYKEAIENVNRYLEAKNWLDAHPEKEIEQNALDFGDFLNEEVYVTVVSIGGLAANELGEFEVANRYWKLLPWDIIDSKEKVTYWNALQRTLQGLKQLQEERKIKEKLPEFVALVKTLLEAGAYAQELAAGENTAVLAEFLSEMQETAITIGTGLDTLLGEGSEEVGLLEAYCEQVWRCSVAETKEEKLLQLQTMMQTIEEVKRKLETRLAEK